MSRLMNAALLTGLLAFSLASAAQKPTPDLILLNGKIFTSNAAHPYVEALAIRGERITATGDSTKIRTLAGPHTKEIDLGGRTVVPGINDAHNHLGVSAPNRVDLELKTPDPVWPEMKAAITAAVLKAPKGSFIYGEIAWKIFRDPAVNRDTLDQVAPNNPVILETLTNHAWILNSAALARAGIRESQPDPPAGATRGQLTAGSPGSFVSMRCSMWSAPFPTRQARRTLWQSCTGPYPRPPSGGSQPSRTCRMSCPPNGALRCWRNCLLQFEFA